MTILPMGTIIKKHFVSIKFDLFLDIRWRSLEQMGHSIWLLKQIINTWHDKKIGYGTLVVITLSWGWFCYTTGNPQRRRSIGH